MSRLPAHVYRLGRSAAVAGLLWSPLERLDASERMKDLRRNARERDARYGIAHETGHAGADGLGIRSVGAILLDHRLERPTQTVSAAVWLAEAYPNDRLVFVDEVGQGAYWVAAVSNGAIDIRADQVLDARSAIERLESIVGDTYGTDDEYRVCTCWDHPLQSALLSRVHLEATSFSELVSGTSAQPHWRLVQLVGVTPRQLSLVMAAIVILMAGLGGVMALRHIQAERALEQEREQARLMQIEAEKLRSLQDVRIAEAVSAAVGEDTMTPAPDAVIRACVEAYQRMGPRLGGWLLESATCEPDGAGMSFNYSQQGLLATNRDIDAHARALGLVVNIDVQASRATLRLPLAAQSPREPLRPEQLPPWTRVQIELPTRLQLLRRATAVGSVVITPPAARAVVFRDPAKDSQEMRFSPVPQDKAFRKGSLSMAANSLWSLPRFSLEYPFVTLTKLELRQQGAAVQWTLEASYVVGNS